MPHKNKEVRKEYMKQWQKNNPEYMKKWQESNPEYYKEYHKVWSKNNIEKIRIIFNRWLKDNQDYMKNYYLNNKEKIKKQSNKWREENPEYNKKYRRNWRKTEKGKALNQRNHFTRRVKEKKIINTLTSNEWLETLKKYHWRCAYCGKEFDLFTKPERDHIIPISKGGNNTKENIVPACRNCNSKKYNKILIKTACPEWPS